MTLRRLVVLATIAATVVVFVMVDGRSHSVSDTLYGIVVPEGIVLLAAAGILLAGGRFARGRS